MSQCWAECLGDCSERISKEHTLAEGLFLDKMIRVKGLPWCKDDFKEISKANLTRKVLCTYHNNRLSKVDEGGIAAARLAWSESLSSSATTDYERAEMMAPC